MKMSWPPPCQRPSPMLLSVLRKSAVAIKHIWNDMQEGLRAVCEEVVRDAASDCDDVSTSAGSMSGTTLPAVSKGGPAVAAKYLLQLGKAHWGWQETQGDQD